MTTADRPPVGGAPVQPWRPGAAAPGGVTCPACGLANEPGARTCRNCGLPIAAAGDPLRGVTPGHVVLPRARRSGLSATIGFVMVVALLLAGGSLAFSGGGGLLSSGGRFFSDASPSPSAAARTVTGAVDPSAEEGTPSETPPPDALKASKPNMDAYVCGPGAIKDLSRGRWFLVDVQAGPRTADQGIDPDGSDFDQVYWRLSRQGKVKPGKATTVTMRRSTPEAAKERFGDSIGRVQGDTAIILTFDGPVDITANSNIEQNVLDAADLELVRRVQLFEKSGKVHTVIGIKGEPCTRLGSTGWGGKSKMENTRVVLDIER